MTTALDAGVVDDLAADSTLEETDDMLDDSEIDSSELKCGS